MSDSEAAVYTGNASRIAIDAILAKLRAAGVPAEWHARMLSEQGSADWTSGYFTAPGARKQEVSLTNEKVSSSDQEDVLDAYLRWGLTPALKTILDGASWKYEVTGSGEPSAERDRLFAGVVRALAEIGQGLVVDRSHRRFFDAKTYPSPGGSGSSRDS